MQYSWEWDSNKTFLVARSARSVAIAEMYAKQRRRLCCRLIQANGNASQQRIASSQLFQARAILRSLFIIRKYTSLSQPDYPDRRSPRRGFNHRDWVTIAAIAVHQDSRETRGPHPEDDKLKERETEREREREREREIGDRHRETKGAEFWFSRPEEYKVRAPSVLNEGDLLFVA